MLAEIRYGIVIIGMAIAVYTDMRKHKIYNKLVSCMAILGLALAVVGGWQDIKKAFAGFLVGLLGGMVLWGINLFRAGDAKLFAALGAIMGLEWLANCFCGAILSGMVIGILYLALRKQLLKRMKRLMNYFIQLMLTRKMQSYQPEEGTEAEMPFAIFVAIGCVVATYFPVLKF